jgi:2-dehydro-3-deoxyphosphooctonate aldolase (KDO 8-P synthase)
MAKVKRELGLPVLTDVHARTTSPPQQAVVDVLQTPALLCRQTDFIRAVAQSGKPVNIKKGQFLAPHDMKNVIDKARAAAKEAGLPERQPSWPASAAPALATTTWSATCARWPSCARRMRRWCLTPRTVCNLPGGQGTSSGGEREMVPVLARAAVAVGVAGLFMETHPDPAKALSDGPNAVPLKHMRALLETLLALDRSPRKTASLKTTSTPEKS